MERKMKNTDEIINLVAGTKRSEDKEEFYSRLEQDPESEKTYNKVKAAWAFLASTKSMPEYKIEDSYQRLHSKLNSRKTIFRIKSYSLLKYAAILVLFLCTIPLTIYIKNQTDNSKLQYTSVVAKNKQISEIILPDSSVVWLNSGSKLTYNNNYSLNNRDLQIIGEAYFDVRKNKKIPLTVSCNDIKVKVLGTKFNVSAYPDDQRITVALASGSVELTNASSKSFKYLLKPGEIAEYNTAKKVVNIKETTINNYTAWRDGLLVFKDKPMPEVLKILQRKFNVTFKVEDTAIYEPLFNATFKDENLIEVLDFIKFTCHIDYKLQKDNSNNNVIRLY